MDVPSLLAADSMLILDGGMASEIQRRGAPMDEIAWSAVALERTPNIVRAVHADYVRAGADVLIANTFSTAPHVLAQVGMADRADALTRRAVALAREAIALEAPGRPVAVAGSLSASMGSGPASAAPRSSLRASYRAHAASLAAAGADLVALEMMVEPDVTEAALLGALESGLPAWLGVSCAVGDDGTVRMFERGDRVLLDEMLERFLPMGPAAVLVMHSEVRDVAPALDRIRRHWDGPIGAYAHRGRFETPHWVFEDTIAPEEYARLAAGWRDLGATRIGGCCGTGPAHVAALAAALRA